MSSRWAHILDIIAEKPKVVRETPDYVAEAEKRVQ
jgi:hypothetical protein